MELVNSTQKKTAYLITKRAFDVVASLFCLVVLSPLFLIVSLLIFLEDGRPIFFRHQRLGKNGKPFEMYKFRTMHLDADHLLTPSQRREYENEFKLENDPRITRVGHLLRVSSLDELPQLWNILKGDMSFVGPRPIVEKEFDYYSPEERVEFQSMLPGLTGYWQAYARNNATYGSGERQAMEMYYVEHASFLLDIRILFKTIDTVIHRYGAK